MTEPSWKDHLKALSWAGVVWGAVAVVIVAFGTLIYFFGFPGMLSAVFVLLFVITYRSALRHIRK